jgi:hypothetical protein
MADFESSIANRLPADLAVRFPGQTEASIRKAELEVWLRTLILRSWRNRHKVAKVFRPLPCYNEAELQIDQNGIIDPSPIKCATDDCCLRKQFAGKNGEIGKMLAVFDQLPKKNETGKRKEALRHLFRTPNRPLSEKQCNALGDAVFVLQCPTDAAIITTNIQDHLPLGEAIGIEVKKPEDV